MVQIRVTAAPLFLVLPLLGACRSIETDVASSVAPDFRAQRYEKIVVSSPGGDLRARRAVEGTAEAALEAVGVEVVQLGEILFPGEDHDEAAVRAAVESSGAGAYLTIVPLQTWVDEYYVPPSFSTNADFGRFGHPYGWGYSTTWFTGGYTVSEPRATFDARLFDVEQEAIAWVASVGVRGASGTTWTEMRSKATATAVEQLIADGMVAVRPSAADG